MGYVATVMDKEPRVLRPLRMVSNTVYSRKFGVLPPLFRRRVRERVDLLARCLREDRHLIKQLRSLDMNVCLKGEFRPLPP